MMSTLLPIALLLVLCLTSDAAASASATTVRQEESPASFSYDQSAPNGPPMWHTLDDSYTVCGTGRAQSPINFPCPAGVADHQVLQHGPQVSTTNAHLHMEGTTHNFELACEQKGSCGMTTFDGVKYDLVNVHFHSPSEHHVGGVAYPLEAHMVHASSDGALLVLSVMFSYGADGDCITTAPFPSGSHGTLTSILTRARVGITDLVVNTGSFLAADTSFSMYSGSLTTPPCTEGVTWLLANRRQTISPRQVQQFLSMTDSAQFGNARNVHQRNGRPLSFAPTDSGRSPLLASLPRSLAGLPRSLADLALFS